MDLATVGGLTVTIGLIMAGILMGGPLGIFIDIPSMLIVIGGTIGVTFVGFPAGAVIGAMKAGKQAVFSKPEPVQETIKLLSELSNRARREGLLSLESAAQETEDDFLKRGLLMVVDGHEPAAIEEVLYDELDKIEERHKVSAAVWDAIGAYGPAMGMIGTLIGLVQMLQNLSDPAAIGPAMAVALLTTFYGSLLANIIGIPVCNKLKVRSGIEVAAKTIIAQGLLSILNGENPRFMVDRLNASLAPAERVLDEAA
ncbi:MAG: motility protein A [Proteobacteria bacterium]|nr:motility protein A [Pseudomonadota bacterium]MCP4919859.1 motility protein A [Pseudomonadota bacterium]